MNESHYQEIDKLLDELGDPNFIAFANGGFQMQSTCAFFLQRQAQGEHFKGIVVSYVNRLTAPDCAVLAPEDFRFLYNYTPGKSSLADKLKAWEKPKVREDGSRPQKPFYLIFMSKMHLEENLLTHLRERYPDRPVQVIITSEGTQNYVGETLTGNGLFYAQKSKKYPWKAIYYLQGCLVTIYKAALLKHLLNLGMGEDYKFLRKEKDKGFLPVDPERAYLRQAFEKASAAKGLQLPKDHYKNAVLLCEQPFIEQDGLCEEEAKILKECNRILSELGYRILVKPHPAEKKIERYPEMGLEMDTCGSKEAIEYLLAAAIEKPAAIVGYGSTAMVTGNLLWGIPGISLSKMIDERTRSPYMNYLVSNVLKTFKQVTAPHDYKELEKSLKSIKQLNQA